MAYGCRVIEIIVTRKTGSQAGELAQRLRALAALLEDLGSILSIQFSAPTWRVTTIAATVPGNTLSWLS